MKNRRIGLSLRYKLLLILTLLPLVSLGAYLLMATRLFEQDKIAYVFDSSVAVSRFLANQTQTEFESYVNVVRPVIEGYQVEDRSFSFLARDLFKKQPRVEALVLAERGANSASRVLGRLSKDSTAAKSFFDDTVKLASIVQRLSIESVVIERSSVSQEYLTFAYRLGNPVENQPLRMVISLYKSKQLTQAFLQSNLYNSYLIDSKGQVFLGPAGASREIASSMADLFHPVVESKTPEGTAEVIQNGATRMLLSYSKLSVGGLSVASLVNRDDALKAVEMMVSKSVLFFITLLSGTILISIFASVRLTSALRELYEATRKIANGDFDVRVRAGSGDEVGGLADSFNWMAGEVSRLLSETAQKARMENELATVRTVQETLFPVSESRFEGFSIVGHFEPASECGGDWWNYSQVGDKIYLWIGDATGHGAPAALITSAARSAAAIIETLPDITPGKALEIMNRAIYETSKGKILMTFFLGCIDPKSNKLIYSNASHDPPYLVRRKEGKKISKRDLLPLMEEIGTRLGDKPHAEYKEVSVELEPGDLLMFYTDGVLDVKNDKGEVWGERNFLKVLMESIDQGETTKDKMEQLKSRLRDHRQGSDLIDDVTLFMCEYEKVS